MKKKSGKIAAQRFRDRIQEIEAFCGAIDQAGLSKSETSIAYDGAVIKLAVCFEQAMLESLVVATNNNTSHISASFGVQFPKHLSDEVCEHLITGGGYFDFKGRSGLISDLKKFLPATHYLVVVVKKPAYLTPLDRLIALRNFAAHESPQSKETAKTILGIRRLASAGAWLKTQNRLLDLSGRLEDLADDLEQQAPY